MFNSGAWLRRCSTSLRAAEAEFELCPGSIGGPCQQACGMRCTSIDPQGWSGRRCGDLEREKQSRYVQMLVNGFVTSAEVDRGIPRTHSSRLPGDCRGCRQGGGRSSHPTSLRGKESRSIQLELSIQV